MDCGYSRISCATRAVSRNATFLWKPILRVLEFILSTGLEWRGNILTCVLTCIKVKNSISFYTYANSFVFTSSAVYNNSNLFD